MILSGDAADIGWFTVDELDGLPIPTRVQNVIRQAMSCLGRLELSACLIYGVADVLFSQSMANLGITWP